MKGHVRILAVLAVCGVAAQAMACDTCGCSPAVKKAEATEKACSPAVKAGCTACTAATAEKQAYTKIDTVGLDKLIKSGEEFVLLDARSGKYDDGRRIANAQQLAANASEAEIAKALPNKDAKIVAYCTSTKCPASAMLLERLSELGYDNLVKYPDGIDGWAESGKQ